MSDTTYVSLWIPIEHRETVEAIAQKWGENWDVTDALGNKAFFSFPDIEDGFIEWLPELIDAGIAYDSVGEAGVNYQAITYYCRFTADGEAVLLTVVEDQQNVPLHTLLPLIDDFQQLRAAILAHKEKVTPLPWDNQVAYGKLYRTKKLLTG